jgi:penicillin-binding protein 2
MTSTPRSSGLGKLIEMLPKDRKRFRKLLEESKTFESLPIRTRLTEEEVARFAANRYLFPGVEVKARLFRQYPLGPIASHAIGYINRINKRDLELIEESEQEANYKGTDHIGKTGIEQKYEFQLHGETGYEQVEIDAGGRAVRKPVAYRTGPGQQPDADARRPIAGNGRKGFWRPPRGRWWRSSRRPAAFSRWSQRPTFDPNLFVDGIRSDDWDLLNNSPDKPLLNRALNGAYPPGSTFKPFMALAALETWQTNRFESDHL